MARLLAADREDLETIAALLQDSLLRACDSNFDARRRTLTLLFNRFHWEEKDPKRGYCLVRLCGVTKAQRRSWPDHCAAVLELLHIDGDDDIIELIFAGGTAVRCRIEAIDVVMEDVGEAWPVETRPDHADDEDPEPDDEMETAQPAAG